MHADKVLFTFTGYPIINIYGILKVDVTLKAKNLKKFKPIFIPFN